MYLALFLLLFLTMARFNLLLLDKLHDGLVVIIFEVALVHFSFLLIPFEKQVVASSYVIMLVGIQTSHNVVLFEVKAQVKVILIVLGIFVVFAAKKAQNL